MRTYFAEIAELFAGLACASLNHWNGCAILSYRTRFWNPIAFIYHWGSDVAFENGRYVQRCGCVYPPKVETVSHDGVNTCTVTYPVNT